MTDDTSPVAASAEAEGPSLGAKTRRGLSWSLLGTVGTKAGSFALNLVLARLLAPQDFGVFAIALAAWAFLIHVNDAGIIAAVVQWRGKLEEMAPTAAVLAFVSSALVYVACWFAAPYYAHLAHSDAATGPIRLLCVVVVVDGITAVRSGSLMRAFRQDTIVKANVVGLVCQAPVAIALALADFGPYSFVWGQVVASVVAGALILVWADVPVEFGFDRAVARRLLRFGLPLAASLGIESVLLNADYVIVGHVLGTVAIGYYMIAFNVSSWVPTLIGQAIRYVSTAAFSRLAERDDPDSLSDGVRRSLPLLLAFVFPAAVLLATLATPLLELLYGARWTPGAVVLGYLAILMAVRMITSLTFDVLTAAGRTRATMWLNLAWVVVLVPALLAGVRADGIRGVGIAHALVGAAVALPLALLALHRAGVRLAPALPALARPAGAAALTAAVVLGLDHAVTAAVGPVALARLVVAGGVGILVYLLLVVPKDAFLRVAHRLPIPATTKEG
ncbi:oligosaccharide flippase family protein [Actinomadura rupiterrae]|uniref:oligosaccharide flippase family protein n=1 Tax=Actinomadura rupiterrae TaxID=559627 RepID=UPI0020A412A7|nr:oligosaccharide flippase family protein [Actinomadura rupiterrae]MCP2338068.1 PST family polysaccharide transporter [Actinomadura rupiterrae]